MHPLPSAPTDAGTISVHRHAIANGSYGYSAALRCAHQRHWFLQLQLGPKAHTHEATVHQLHSTPTDAHPTLAHRDILYEIIADGPFSCSTDLRRTHDAAEHQRHWFLLLRLGPKTPTHEATVHQLPSASTAAPPTSGSLWCPITYYCRRLLSYCSLNYEAAVYQLLSAPMRPLYLMSGRLLSPATPIGAAQTYDAPTMPQSISALLLQI